MYIMKNLPSAEQARIMVENGNNNKSNEQWEYVSTLILEAINNGRRYVSESGILMDSNKEKLRKLGYEVNTGSQYNESYYNITW